MSDDVLTYRWWVSRIDCWLRFSSRPHRGVHGDSRIPKSACPGNDEESDEIDAKPGPITPGTPPDPYLFVRLTHQPDA